MQLVLAILRMSSYNVNEGYPLITSSSLIPIPLLTKETFSGFFCFYVIILSDMDTYILT